MILSLGSTLLCPQSFRGAAVLFLVPLVAVLACALAEAQPKAAAAPPEADLLPKPRSSGLETRSMVMTKFGIVATSQTLASRAGAQILELGGNAVDAAIAANATLGVLEPTSNGLGGDLFAIVYEAKSGKLYGLNASGWAPAKMNVDFVRGRGHESMPHDGILTVTVPGCVAGWDALRRKFGTLPFEKLL